MWTICGRGQGQGDCGSADYRFIPPTFPDGGPTVEIEVA